MNLITCFENKFFRNFEIKLLKVVILYLLNIWQTIIEKHFVLFIFPQEYILKLYSF